MKSSLSRKTSITLPGKLEDELRVQADAEHRTLSGILQEAARVYLNVKRWEHLQRELAPKARRLDIRDEEDVNRLIHRLRR